MAQFYASQQKLMQNQLHFILGPSQPYLKEELKEGRITGPFPMAQLPEVQCNINLGDTKIYTCRVEVNTGSIIPKATQCQ